MSWARSYIGLRWIPYATGPDAYDCWGLVFHCLEKHYGVSVDRFKNVITDDSQGIHNAAEVEAQKTEWIELSEPREGAVVLMGKRKIIHHIGIYTEGKVLHSRDGADVAFETVERIKADPIMSIKLIKFYIHDSLFKNS